MNEQIDKVSLIKHAGLNFDVNEKMTAECRTATFQKLKKVFKNVYVIEINNDLERYRIGSDKNDAILGEDYIVMDKNLTFFHFLSSIENAPNSTIPYDVWYKFDDRSVLEYGMFEGAKIFCSNGVKIKLNFFHFLNICIEWIGKHFPNFKI